MNTPVPPQRLRDNDIGEALSRLNELLEELEQTPGPAGRIAADAVSALAQLYGEALARAIGYVLDTPSVRETFLNDELLGHLLVLHDLHPEPVDRRLARLIAKMSTLLDDHGARVELVGVTDSVATVRLAAHGCGSAGIAETVRDALLAATPELSDVSVVSAAPHESAFVPLDKLMAHTSANGGRP